MNVRLDYRLCPYSKWTSILAQRFYVFFEAFLCNKYNRESQKKKLDELLRIWSPTCYGKNPRSYLMYTFALQ